MDKGVRNLPQPLGSLNTLTKRSESGYGKGFSRTLLTTLNIEVLAPIPMASINTTMSVKPGLFRNCRKANLMSLIRVLTSFVLRWRVASGEWRVKAVATV